MSQPDPSDVSIGKFDILATLTMVQGLAEGVDEAKAKHMGMVAAVMGAQIKRGLHKSTEYHALTEAAEKKKKSSITAESFDRQVNRKMGSFFAEAFLPSMKKLVEAGVSYPQVKRIVRIPPTWGAKITGEQLKERVADFLAKKRAR